MVMVVDERFGRIRGQEEVIISSMQALEAPSSHDSCGETSICTFAALTIRYLLHVLSKASKPHEIY